jgi:hypothetical protein
MTHGTDMSWVDALQPKLEEIDREIGDIEAKLERLRSMRQGLWQLIEAARSEVRPGSSSLHARVGSSTANGRKLSAKECLIRVLKEAGHPLTWNEVQRRVAEFPRPPTPGALTSAFYHNTKGGSRTFLALGRGYAGLVGRDEDWEPGDGREAHGMEETVAA